MTEFLTCFYAHIFPFASAMAAAQLLISDMTDGVNEDLSKVTAFIIHKASCDLI